ncbi:MAG: hypothetical protein AAFV88_16840 [Planctomycetota bacterium]
MLQRRSIRNTASRCLKALLMLPILFALLAGGTADAAAPMGNPGTPLLKIDLDLDTLAESEIGKLLLEAGIKLTAQQMEKDPEKAMEALIESLGFDPMKQAIHLTATIDSLDDPIEGLSVNVRFKDSTGNLEGFLLAAPDYKSTTEGGHTVHVVTFEGEVIHIVFGDASSGEKHVIASSSKKYVMDELGELDSQSASDQTTKVTDGKMLAIELLSIPEEIADQPPFANIANMMSSCDLSIHEEDENLVVQFSMTATDEQRATQMQQLVQGGVAMIGLFKDEIQKELEDEDVASSVIPVLNQIKVNRKKATVTIQSMIPETLIIDFLREEAGLPL